jgi:hypothetical protein
MEGGYYIKIEGTVSSSSINLGREYIEDVENEWNKTFYDQSGTMYTIDVQLTLVRYGKGHIDLTFNFGAPALDRSKEFRANAQLGGRQANLWSLDTATTKAHEFGHNIGFADAYIDKANSNGTVSSHLLTRRGDIMGSRTGSVQWYHANTLVEMYKHRD